MAAKSSGLEELGSSSERRLELYVAGQSQRALQAMTDLRRFVDERRGQGWTLEVVDLLQDRERAHRAGVRLAPTVIFGERRAVGSFSDIASLLEVLGLPA